jgi:hypothetical protein
MDNKLLSEAVNELYFLNVEFGKAIWDSSTEDELLAVINSLQEDLNSIIAHIEYQK